MKLKLFSIGILAVIAGLSCWQFGIQPSLAQAPASQSIVPTEIAQCMPAQINGAMNLQASTSLDGKTYFLYYVADSDSDDGYDILIEQSGAGCQRLLGPETQVVYAFSHYIPFQAAYQLWQGIYRQRIDAAGGVAQYQRQIEGEDAASCPCYVSDEEARAMELLGIKVSPHYLPYPPEGFRVNR